MKKAKIWYLPGPFFRYEQDVKELARKAGVRIVDANVTDDRTDAADEKALPRVSLKPEYMPAKVKAAKTDKTQVDADEAARLAAAALSGGQGA